MGMENVGELPAVFVGRHQNLYGPVEIIAWVPMRFRVWTIYKFMSLKECYRHYAESFFPRKGIGPTGSKLRALIAAPLVSAFMRSMGGITVDRTKPQGVVEDLAARAATAEHLHLVIAVEGTRARKRYWKSGFYRIAQQADVPMCLGFCDGPTRTVGYGPTIRATGDVRADMDLIRAFYADKRGVNPQRRTEPRLREEHEPPAA
jgi:hypothetical protein